MPGGSALDTLVTPHVPSTHPAPPRPAPPHLACDFLLHFLFLFFSSSPSAAQVFISYGPVPNLKLLCYYGFVVAGNPHDLVPLQLEVGAAACSQKGGLLPAPACS